VQSKTLKLLAKSVGKI